MKQSYVVTKPFPYAGRLTKVGESVDLTGRQALYLGLAGKVKRSEPKAGGKAKSRSAS